MVCRAKTPNKAPGANAWRTDTPDRLAKVLMPLAATGVDMFDVHTERFRAAGLETEIVPYKVLLNQPKAVRVEAWDGAGKLLLSGPTPEHLAERETPARCAATIFFRMMAIRGRSR